MGPESSPRPTPTPRPSPTPAPRPSPPPPSPTPPPGFAQVTKYYIYDGERPILEYDGNGELAGYNLYGKGVDEILLRNDPTLTQEPRTFYYQQDHEGSVTHLTDENGNVIEKYRYDVFGAPTILDPDGVTVRTASIVSNRFLFTGREYNALFGFYEYRARAYHPSLGRFMSEDPKLFDAGDYNLFRYCHNDPIDFTDPMGLAGDAGGYARIDTPSLERLWDVMKHFDRSNIIQGNFSGFGYMSGLSDRDAKGRSVTSGEIREAKHVFEQKIHYDDVRVIDRKANWFQGSNYAVTIGNHIYWPHAPKDFSKLSGPEGLFKLQRFIHEMTHVMQHQHGVNVVAEAIPLQAGHFLTGRLYDPYRNGAYDGRKAFSSYNVEQQGAIAERIYRGELPNTIINYPDLR